MMSAINSLRETHMRIVQPVLRHIRRGTSRALYVCLIPLMTLSAGYAQQAGPEGTVTPSGQRVMPMGEWLEFRHARFTGRPILLHLRNGYERAVLMPEPIRLLDDAQSLPGCAVEIDTDVVGFFPTRTFTRRPIRFTGLDSGTVYELRVRASPSGILQPLQISR
jgi:hypothetical protein